MCKFTLNIFGNIQEGILATFKEVLAIGYAYNANGELAYYEVLIYKSNAAGKNKVSDFPDIEISAETALEGILVT
jgi:hypothetical protein